MNGKPKNNIRFSSFFNHEDILCRTTCRSRNEVIEELLKKLAFNRGIGNVNCAIKDVLEREESQSTIIAKGVAMPHARLEGIKNLVVAIATCPEGIVFNEENRDIKLVILILAPKDSPALYLEALSSMGHVLKDKDVSAAVEKMQSAKDVWNFFDGGEAVLSDYVQASDIMKSNPISIKETDTLETAINLFVKHNLIDLPVVDKDGELVGVVTAYELLRVCLPDYILWIDDLAPVMNFEPFANVLRNESNTWLTEIMSQDYAVMAEDAPAMQAGKEIMKHNTRQAYILSGKKLVGVITLQQFLNKVMRE